MKKLIALVFTLVASLAQASGDAGIKIHSSGADLSDQASLQRGAALFMNYCMGCHSLKYLRYSRMAADLGLTEALYFDGNISRLYAPELARHDGGFPMGPIVGTVVPKG